MWELSYGGDSGHIRCALNFSINAQKCVVVVIVVHCQHPGDEPPGSVHSEITEKTYNLSPISLVRTFSKPNVASLAQVELC